MNYAIQEVEGIGPSYGEKLEGAGITDTGVLLKICGGKSGRKEVAEKTGISETLILEWTNLADLMRVKGVGKQFAELLEASGVDTVKELRNRNAKNLAEKCAEINDVKKLCKSDPSESQCQDWIDQAKEMDPAVEY